MAALGARMPKRIKKASDQIADEQRDYDRFIQLVDAYPKHPDNEPDQAAGRDGRFLRFCRARTRAVAAAKFKELAGWQGDRIEPYIN
jgi:hypothetical protein